MAQANSQNKPAGSAGKAPNTNPQTQPRQVATQAQRTVIGFKTAVQVCPNATHAAAISRAFAIVEVDYDAIREVTEEQVARSAAALSAHLSDKATELHMQRIVDAFVRSAHGAGVFYGTKASLARDLSSQVANEDRDEDRMGVDGTANRANRAREFAAQMAMQAFALLAAAEGAVDAYAQVTGNDWKPYEGNTRPAMNVDRQAAEAQMAALGM
jgi:hypothetical protein